MPDIVEVIQGYTTLKKVSHYFQGICPLHNDTRGSLVVYPATDSWFCFGCGDGGSVIKFIMQAENKSYSEACAQLGIDPGKRRIRGKSFKRIELL